MLRHRGQLAHGRVGKTAAPVHLLVMGWASHAALRLFALLSTAMNMGAQQITVMLLAGRLSDVVHPSLLWGTVAGFVSKDLLDKHCVVCDRSTRRRDEARKLAFSGMFSVVTTVIF